MTDELRRAEAQLQNLIYAATISMLEGLERTQKIAGSGHHMAQRICVVAVDDLRKRWWQPSNNDDA